MVMDFNRLATQGSSRINATPIEAAITLAREDSFAMNTKQARIIAAVRALDRVPLGRFRKPNVKGRARHKKVAKSLGFQNTERGKKARSSG